MEATTSFGIEELVAAPDPRRSLKLNGSADFAFTAKDFVKHRTGALSDSYEIGEQLGSGGYGAVYACVHKETKIERAVKILAKLSSEEDNEATVQKEFNLLKELDHPNILRLIEMFTDENNYYIVTEICRGGELLDEIQEWGNFIEEDAAVLMRHLLGSVNYCHQKGIVHRDLKPENILLEESKELQSIKVIDFGLAQCIEKDTQMHDLAGSIYYIAPEVLLGSHSFKADIWSCGVIAYILLSGFVPFDGHNDDQIKEAIITGEFDFDDEVWEDVSEQALDFVSSLLEFDPADRYTAEEALKHPWIVQSRLDSTERLKRRQSANDRALEALHNLGRFTAQNKLKQATYAFIASQLVLKEEKHRIDELFCALDVNNNGRLSKNDIINGYKDVFGKVLSEEEVSEMFRRADYDNSGYVEYSAFVVATMNEKDLLNNEKLKHAFNMFDVSGTGVISRHDLAEVMSYFQSVDKTLDNEVINRLIRSVDEDENGEICFEEFTNMMLKTAEDSLQEQENLNTIQEDASTPSADEVRNSARPRRPPPSLLQSLQVSSLRPSVSYASSRRGSSARTSISYASSSASSRRGSSARACMALFEQGDEDNQAQNTSLNRPSMRFSIRTSIRSNWRDSQHSGGMSKRSSESSGLGSQWDASDSSRSSVTQNASLRDSRGGHGGLRTSARRPRTARAQAAVFEELIHVQRASSEGPHPLGDR
jgi:calcium-dependent protein kinase